MVSGQNDHLPKRLHVSDRNAEEQDQYTENEIKCAKCALDQPETTMQTCFKQAGGVVP